jgi:hypothetical protein
MSVNMIAASRRVSDGIALLGSFFIGQDYFADVISLSTVHGMQANDCPQRERPKQNHSAFSPPPPGRDALQGRVHWSQLTDCPTLIVRFVESPDGACADV